MLYIFLFLILLLLISGLNIFYAINLFDISLIFKTIFHFWFINNKFHYFLIIPVIKVKKNTHKKINNNNEKKDLCTAHFSERRHVIFSLNLADLFFF